MLCFDIYFTEKAGLVMKLPQTLLNLGRHLKSQLHRSHFHPGGLTWSVTILLCFLMSAIDELTQIIISITYLHVQVKSLTGLF